MCTVHGCCSSTGSSSYLRTTHTCTNRTSTTVLLFSRLDSAMSTLYFFLGLFLGCSLPGTVPTYFCFMCF